MDNLLHIINMAIAAGSLIVAYLAHRRHKNKDQEEKLSQLEKVNTKLCAALIQTNKTLAVLEERQKMQHEHMKELIDLLEDKLDNMDSK